MIVAAIITAYLAGAAVTAFVTGLLKVDDKSGTAQALTLLWPLAVPFWLLMSLLELLYRSGKRL